MKKLIQIASLFLILALVFTSCVKEEPVSEELQQIDDSKETYKFSKSFSLKDDLGNSSEFTVYSDDEQWLDVISERHGASKKANYCARSLMT